MVTNPSVVSPYNQAVEIRFDNSDDYFKIASQIFNGEWGYYGNPTMDNLNPDGSPASAESFGIVHVAFNNEEFSLSIILGNGRSPYTAPEKERVWEVAMEEIDDALASAIRAHIKDTFTEMLDGTNIDFSNVHVDFLESTYNAQVAATESVYSGK